MTKKTLKEYISQKKIPSRAVLYAVTAYVLGAIMGAHFTFTYVVFFALSLVGLLGYFLFWEWKRCGLFLLIAIMFVGMGVSCNAINREPETSAGKHVITGSVQDISPRDNGTTLYTLYNVTVDGEKISKKAFLTSAESYTLDDIISSEASVSLPSRPRYAFGFDDRLYCASQNVAFRAYSTGDELIGREKGIIPAANSLRLMVSSKMDELFGDNAGVAKAFVLGVDWDIYNDSYEMFRMAGISHLLSVSGLHVGFMTIALLYILQNILKLGRTPRNIISIVFLVFYVIFTGGRVPVVRAAVMFGGYILAKQSQRRADRPTILALALLLNILSNPLRLFDVGLQLSFGAVFSLMCIEPAISGALNFPKSKIIRAAVSTFSINLCTLPILINLNNYFWPLTLIVNVFAITIAGIAIPLAALVTLLYIVIGNAAILLGYAVSVLISVLNFLAGLYTLTPQLGVTMHSTYGIAAIMAFLIAFFVSPYSKKLTWRFRRASIGALCICIAALYVLPTLGKAELRVTFLDLGSQDATIVETKDKTLLIDAGKTERTSDYIIKNAIHPDVTIITNQSAEYAYGVSYLSKEKRTGDLYCSEAGLSVLSTSGIYAKAIYAGDTIELSDDVSMRVLSIAGDPLDSIILSIDYRGETAMLYLSDADAAQQYGVSQDAKIVRLAAHGTKAAFNEQVITDANAYAVIACSQRELSSSVTESLKGTRLFQTKYNGTITATWTNDTDYPEIQTMYE